MTTWLLDVNVVIALLDPDHVHHERAHEWFATIDDVDNEWLSCPTTQNGVLRVLSAPKYPNHQPLALAYESLKSLLANENHRFVPDSISLLSDSGQTAKLVPDQLTASGMITDTYLLALASSHDARLATFDRRLVSATVKDGDGIKFVLP